MPALTRVTLLDATVHRSKGKLGKSLFALCWNAPKAKGIFSGAVSQSQATVKGIKRRGTSSSLDERQGQGTVGEQIRRNGSFPDEWSLPFNNVNCAESVWNRLFPVERCMLIAPFSMKGRIYHISPFLLFFIFLSSCRNGCASRS